MNKRTKKTPSVDMALAKARKYCALQERSNTEVRRKLEEYGVMQGDIPVLIDKLTKEGFLNEKRFASAFASGKFRNKKWGQNRIRNEMKRKGLSEELIKQGLSGLSQSDYIETLDKLLAKKWEQLMRKLVEDDYEAKLYTQQKLIAYLLQKGYEQDAIMKRMKELKIF